ncbi:amidase [Noviherbaspirillum massiliense]|uniref:amidase n=1 Tax=Noviherbaspirillum massiliense TaxID=1465823 RepID=UPI0002E17923|nr:amidase [Noviherbaspirillum massiliense]
MESLKEVLAGFAAWLGHDHGDRAGAWMARLHINQPEIDTLRALPTPALPAHVAAPAGLDEPAGTGTPEENTGTGQLEAASALARAREHPDWHIFTRLADAPPQAAPGFLAGMPVVIKDLMTVRGYPLTCGSGSQGQVQEQDAEVVARIRKAGGAIIGTANLHELAYGITSDNPHFGRVRNPVAPERIAGGSSGGTAAAIAAGMAVAGVGTDTAGSIRIPAACCGVVGLKPSYDVLPRAGVADLAPTLDHVGPMADTVEHCAALFAAMLGLPAVPAWRRDNLSGLRIARLGGYFEHPLDPLVAQALDAVMQAAARDGAACSVREIEGCENAPAIQFHTICAEATNANWERLQQTPESIGEDVRVRLEIGLFLPAPLYVKAQRLRRQLAERMEEVLREADILICATLRAPAPPVGAPTVAIGDVNYPMHTAATQLTLPFNLTGLPALSLPWSRTTDGVPVCIQIVGRRGADWQVLAVAQRLQQLAPWRRDVSTIAASGESHARG